MIIATRQVAEVPYGQIKVWLTRALEEMSS